MIRSFGSQRLEGDYHLALTLPADLYESETIFRNLSLFMASKQSIRFTLASKLYEPDCVYCVGIFLNDRHACLARIRCEPTPWTVKNFGAVTWLPDDSIDPMLLDLLPRGAREITASNIATLENGSARGGNFPKKNRDRRVRDLKPEQFFVADIPRYP